MSVYTCMHVYLDGVGKLCDALRVRDVELCKGDVLALALQGVCCLLPQLSAVAPCESVRMRVARVHAHM